MRFISLLLTLTLLIIPLSVNASAYGEQVPDIVDDEMLYDIWDDHYRYRLPFSYSFSSEFQEKIFSIHPGVDANDFNEAIYKDSLRRFEELLQVLDTIDAIYIHSSTELFVNGVSEFDAPVFEFDAIYADKDIMAEWRGIISRAKLTKNILSPFYTYGDPYSNRNKNAWCFNINGKLVELFTEDGMSIKSRYTFIRDIAVLEFATKEDKKRYSEIVDIIDALLKKKCYALLSSAKYNAYIAK